MKSVNWFSAFLGAVFGTVVSTGAIVTAASGDLIYQDSPAPVAVSANQAAVAADWFIARGAWDGDRADIVRCKIERHTDTETGFRALCLGLKTVTPANLPNKQVTVVGKVQ